MVGHWGDYVTVDTYMGGCDSELRFATAKSEYFRLKIYVPHWWTPVGEAKSLCGKFARLFLRWSFDLDGTCLKGIWHARESKLTDCHRSILLRLSGEIVFACDFVCNNLDGTGKPLHTTWKLEEMAGRMGLKLNETKY